MLKSVCLVNRVNIRSFSVEIPVYSLIYRPVVYIDDKQVSKDGNILRVYYSDKSITTKVRGKKHDSK